MVVLQVGACGCGFFLAEACQRVFDPILLSCAKKSGVEPPRRSCGESCCAAAQLNKRAAALLKSLGFSTICAEKNRECLRLRRHSLSVLQLRRILFSLQRSDCRAASFESFAVTRHFCSAKVLVRGHSGESEGSRPLCLGKSPEETLPKGFLWRFLSFAKRFLSCTSKKENALGQSGRLLPEKHWPSGPHPGSRSKTVILP